MAVNSLGYRKWSGKLAPAWTRVHVIARTGIRRAWTIHWLRRALFFAALPVLWFALGFFIYEKSIEYPDLADGLTPFISTTVDSPQLDMVLDTMSDTPEEARHGVWAWLLHSFFRNSQAIVLALIVGLIAPPLISQDIRSRAFLLYFSRPLGRFEYVLGKLVTVWAYLAMITIAPAIVLYVLGILLSPELSVVAATWDLPLRVLAATAVVSVPTASLALCISSLTQESRIAAFAWFAIWILGFVTFGILSSVEGLDSSITNSVPFNQESVWSHVSLYHTLGRVQSWVFGFAEFAEVRTSAIILCVVTIVSLVILLRRVVAPMRA
jgi:ABC-type transport system involved in multi-copper enzyme maturation permease subunit